MYNRLEKQWLKAKELLRSKPEPYVPTQRHIHLTKATRRLLRQSYRHHQALLREKQTRERLEWYLDEKALRAEVKEIRKARYQPHARLRQRSEPVSTPTPRPVLKLNGITSIGPVGYFTWGSSQVFSDYHPTVISSIGKRLNPMKANKSWSNSTSTDMVWKGPRVVGSYPKGKWALNARYLHPVSTDLTTFLSFNDGAASYALQKAYAKVKEPDLALNEYIVEGRQVMNLLKDPFVTLQRFHRLMKKWFDKDAWVYTPPVKVRRYSNGTLISHASPGQTMMSFRTRKELDVSMVPINVLQAAANRGLQWRYGIMPLWLDICAILGGFAEKPPSKKWNVGSARHWLSRSKTSDQLTSKWGHMNQLYASTVRKGEFYSAGVSYRLKRSLPLSYRAGLHPSQFMRVLWNAATLSFVVDWALNIDQWLLAGTSMPGLEIGPNYVTAKSYTTVTSTLIKAYIPGFESEPAKLSSNAVYRFGYERVNRCTSLPWNNELHFSDAWKRLRNLATAEALALGYLFKGQPKRKV